jgi:hypothetical protein
VISAAIVLAAVSALRVEPADLPGLLWSTGAADCAGDEIAARQCRGVRAARALALRGRTFVTAGEVERIAGGFIIRGCLRCGDGLVVVTRGGVTVESGRIVGPEIDRGEGPPPAGVDLEFRLDGAERWTQGGREGIAVELVAWHLVLAEAEAPPASEAVDPMLPLQPAASDVKSAMNAVATEVARCFDRYGVAGSADVWVEVAGDGAVSYAETRGVFFDTPTGACVAAAVRKARFPRFRQAPMRLHYPFFLR